MIHLYGLKNCDTCRKAWKWLEGEGIDYQFFDIRKDGFTAAQASHWIDVLGVDSLINRRGTTWRTLDGNSKDLSDPARVVALIMHNPALIKRPLIENEDVISVGFNDDVKSALVS